MIARSVRRPVSPWERAAGLIGRTHLAASSALWLEPCCGVHTIGMRFAIDVVFLDAAWRVLAVRADVPPMRPAVMQSGAAVVIELPAGCAKQMAIVIGQCVELAPAGARGEAEFCA